MQELEVICEKAVDAEGVYSSSLSHLLRNGDSVVLLSEISETTAKYKIKCCVETKGSILNMSGIEVL